jgi:hypothetical protein
MTPRAPKARTPAGRAHWASRIATAWRKSLEAILETGRLLTAAKGELDHGEFLAMIERDLPFGPSTAQRLMKIAADERLTNTAHGPFLPPSWRTLYELTKAGDELFEAWLSTGKIRSDMERGEVLQLLEKAQVPDPDPLPVYMTVPVTKGSNPPRSVTISVSQEPSAPVRPAIQAAVSTAEPPKAPHAPSPTLDMRTTNAVALAEGIFAFLGRDGAAVVAARLAKLVEAFDASAGATTRH